MPDNVILRVGFLGSAGPQGPAGPAGPQGPAGSGGLTVEQVQDLIAAMFQSGTHTNASVSYDDNAGTISISAVGGGGGGLTQEQVEDFVGGLVTQGTGISVTYDDASNVLTIALSGESFTSAEKNKLAAVAAGATANATDAQLRDRSTHTGTQAISTVTGLQTALDGKAATIHSHAVADVTGLQGTLDALSERQNNWIGTQAEYDALPQAQRDDPTITHLVTS